MVWTWAEWQVPCDDRRERGAPVPPDQWLEVARQIKEAHCYTCSDIAKVCRPLWLTLALDLAASQECRPGSVHGDTCYA